MQLMKYATSRHSADDHLHAGGECVESEVVSCRRSLGSTGVSGCRHQVHHLWQPPRGQQGIWQGLQRSGGHLSQAGARL